VDEIENMTRQLERLLGDPIADAVAGTVMIVSVSEPTRRWGYQACQIEIVPDAPGIEPVRVATEVVTTRKHWPKVGGILPARISTTRPERMDINWDALARG
jgi:hypothetical protein